MLPGSSFHTTGRLWNLANLMFPPHGHVVQQPLMVVKYNAKSLSYFNCKRGKVQRVRLRVQMHPWGMCTFQYPLHLRADIEGKCRGTLWIKMSHRFYTVLLQTSWPHRSFWALSTWKGFCLFIKGEHILSKRALLLLILSSERAALISSDWSHKNKISWGHWRRFSFF